MTVFGILWFVLIAVLIIGYFVLDGMDLGVGVLYPFLGKDEHDKELLIRSVGPIWDGNEVWLLTAGGALFAAFAPAYATSFSGFYLAIMLVLFGLIARAVAVEFRGHEGAPKKLCDICFFIGSLLPALLLGVAMGNVVSGLELNAHGDYTAGFFALLNPFSLLCGVLGLVHMLGQGAAWVALKAPRVSKLQAEAAGMRRMLAIVELVVFIVASLLFFLHIVPHSAVGLGVTLLGAIFAVVYVISLVLNMVLGGNKYAEESSTKRDVWALVASALGCVGLVGLTQSTLFPNLIPASNMAEWSITIANAASSDTALKAMTIIACIGVPLVLIYHVIIYRTYRGRL